MNARRFVAAASLVLWLGGVAEAQISRPNPTATPQSDIAAGLGLPRPTTAPSCALGEAKLFADQNGCSYLCSTGRVSILGVVTGITCLFPTPQPTATP